MIFDFNSPIPTIDEFNELSGLGAVDESLLAPGISCVRRCGVLGTSHLNFNNKIHSKMIEINVFVYSNLTL